MRKEILLLAFGLCVMAGCGSTANPVLPTITPTSTAAPVTTNTPKPTPVLTYTIFEYDYGTLYTKQAIKVYSTPHAMGELLDTLARGETVHVTARCIENDWVRLDYNGTEGYAPATYIGKKAPQELSLASNEVLVPDVSGMTEEEATKTLNDLGLKVSKYLSWESSITYAADIPDALKDLLGGMVSDKPEYQCCIVY